MNDIIAKKNNNRKFFIIITLLLILLAVFNGLQRIYLSDFCAINGDFQNYNTVRRLLNGQIPFKDFACYLGCGQLMLCGFFQLLFGNNFTISLFITNMLVLLIFEFSIVIFSYLILNNKKQALCVSVFFTLINIIRPEFIFNILMSDFIQSFDFGKSPGNSARIIRSAIIPIVVFFILLLLRLIIKKTKNITKKRKILIFKTFIAAIAGFAILWSNDVGTSVYISLSFIYLLALIKIYNKNIVEIIKSILLYIVISASSLLLGLLIITRGHITSWFEMTLGIGNFQRWYYGIDISWKNNMSLLNINVNVLILLSIFIVIYNIYQFFKTKSIDKNCVRYALIAFSILSSIISSYAYQFLSGGQSVEMLYLILLVTIISYFILFIKRISKIDNKILYNKIAEKVALIFLIIIVFNMGASIVSKERTTVKNAVYIDELGGYFSELGPSILYSKDRIGNAKIFSTYSSAIEASTNQFQPSGSDYIIHAMGYQQRENYLDSFNKGNFKYVTTINESHYEWEYWVRNANWFFYRELYANYEPVFVTKYNIFWKKSITSNKENVEIKANIEQQNLREYKISLNAPKNFSGIVDVKIKYKSNFTRSFYKTLDINKYVLVEDKTGMEISNNIHSNYFIPDVSEGYNVSITIINGYGEINISSYPENDSKLEISNTTIENIYIYPFSYAVASNINNNIYQNGINKESKEILIENTKKNRIAVNNAKALSVGNTKVNILNYAEENDYIKIYVDGDISKFVYPEVFKVVN